MNSSSQRILIYSRVSIADLPQADSAEQWQFDSILLQALKKITNRSMNYLEGAGHEPADTQPQPGFASDTPE